MYKDYPFLYETHLHTNVSSKCGQASPVDMVKACKAKGYSGIIITEHNWGGNTAISSDLPWEQWVREFVKSYHMAKEWGDQNDFDVFFGYEAGFHGTEFLIYGVDEEWMIAHPELRDADVEKQYQLIHEAGGMVIHAHPYREEDYIPEIRLFPEFVDGVEAVNATHSNSNSKAHNDPMFDEKAIQYAKEHDFPMTAGSDIHSTNIFGGGICFPRRLKSIQDYMDYIRNSRDYLLTNGEKWYDSRGNLLS